MKKNKVRVYFYLITLVLVSLSWVGIEVEAEEMPVSIKAILPKNQYNPKVTYYDLMMAPEQEQDIEIEMFNSSDEEVEVGVKLYAAATNDNGVLDYSMEGKKYDESLKHPFPTIASTEERVKISGKQRKNAVVHLKMPKEAFDGIILGGINVRLIKKDHDEANSKKAGMKIDNELRYTIGVLLRENEIPIEPDMKLKEVYASQVNKVNTIKATLQNPSPDVIEKIEYEGKIYREKGKEVLFETKQEEYRMAPNSNFNYLISLETTPFKAGKYRLELSARGRDQHGNNKDWKFTKVFEITRQKAKELNDKAIELEKPNYTLYYILGAVLLLVVILILIFVRMKKKQKELIEKLNRNKNRKSKNDKKRKSERSNKTKEATIKSPTRKKRSNK